MSSSILCRRRDLHSVTTGMGVPTSRSIAARGSFGSDLRVQRPSRLWPRECIAAVRQSPRRRVAFHSSRIISLGVCGTFMTGKRLLLVQEPTRSRRLAQRHATKSESRTTALAPTPVARGRSTLTPVMCHRGPTLVGLKLAGLVESGPEPPSRHHRSRELARYPGSSVNDGD